MLVSDSTVFGGVSVFVGSVSLPDLRCLVGVFLAEGGTESTSEVLESFLTLFLSDIVSEGAVVSSTFACGEGDLLTRFTSSVPS